MSDEMAATGQRIFELFGACAADPDDADAARSADEALWEMEALLVAADEERARTP